MRLGVPRIRPRNTVHRVVERFGPTSVSCANVRASRHKLLGDACFVGRSRHVQRRIASVDIVGDLLEVVCSRRFAGRADFDSLSCERGRLREQPRGLIERHRHPGRIHALDESLRGVGVEAKAPRCLPRQLGREFGGFEDHPGGRAGHARLVLVIADRSRPMALAGTQGHLAPVEQG